MRLEDRDYQRLKIFIHDNYGVNLEGKKTLIEGRLSGVLPSMGYSSFTDYVNGVLKDPKDTDLSFLLSRLTTNYTYFMREQKHYDFMTQTALPYWKLRIKDRDLRTWSAGCSSGEEAFTAAMVIGEFLDTAARQWDYTILATDISEKVLQRGMAGVYSEEALDNLPSTWRLKYFEKMGAGQYRVSPQLKKLVHFARFNLMSEKIPFRKHFHIIFCRNVMIYFDSATRAKLIKRFVDALEPGGYLFIGLSENITQKDDRLEYIQPSIYRKRGGV